MRIRVLYIESMASSEYNFTGLLDREFYFPFSGHDDIYRQQICTFIGQRERAVARVMGAPHGRHAGITRNFHGSVLLVVAVEYLNFYDNRSQLRLFVKFVDEIIPIPKLDFFAGPGITG